MAVFLTIIYVALLFVLIKTGKVPNSKTTWLTIIPYELLLLIGLFIPMQWGAPTGSVTIVTYSVGITPNVTGEVIEVPVQPNVPLKKGDVLFKIDPTPYRAALDDLNAQLSLAKLRLEQSRSLAEQNAGSIYEVQSYQAQVDGLKAQIANAEYNLQETVVRAPAEGYVTNVTLRPGTRVANLPLLKAMAFIDTSEKALAAQVHQAHSRYIETEQPAEVTFKSRPGKVYPANVMYVVSATAQGQLQDTGTAIQPISTTPDPFMVRLKLDDPEIENALIPGSVGSIAIYTSRVKMTHIIRKVIIRITAITNYFKAV